MKDDISSLIKEASFIHSSLFLSLSVAACLPLILLSVNANGACAIVTDGEGATPRGIEACAGCRIAIVI